MRRVCRARENRRRRAPPLYLIDRAAARPNAVPLSTYTVSPVSQRAWLDVCIRQIFHVLDTNDFVMVQMYRALHPSCAAATTTYFE